MMPAKSHWLSVLLLFAIMSLMGSCAQKIGENLVQGAMKGLNKDGVDSTFRRLTTSAVESALETALRDSVQARLRQQLDSIGQVLDRRANATAVHLRDSLLSEYTSLWLNKRITEASSVFQQQLVSILNDARGEKTRRLVADLRTELLNDSTLRRAGLFRDELLGINTRTLLDSLLQQTVKGIINSQIRPNTDAIIKDINERAEAGIAKARRIAIILGIGAVIFLIAAGLLYRKAWLHKGTLKILTQQINQIPDQQTYDQLVRGIRQQTVAQGLEPNLQAILKEENLYQQEQWQQKDHQVLNLISEYLNEAPPTTPTGTLVSELYRKAKAVELEDHLKSVLSRNQVLSRTA